MSIVWQFFDICPDNEGKGMCRLCNAVLSRGGKNTKSYGTSAFINHLRLKHGMRFDRNDKYNGKRKYNYNHDFTDEQTTNNKSNKKGKDDKNLKYFENVDFEVSNVENDTVIKQEAVDTSMVFISILLQIKQ